MHKLTKNQLGLSLVELIVSVGIGVLAVYGVTKLASKFLAVNEDSTSRASSDAALKLIAGQIRPTLSRVLWEEYFAPTTFFRVPLNSMNNPIAISPSPNPSLSSIQFGRTIRRDSHTLPIRNFQEKLNSKYRAVWFSRCIPKRLVKADLNLDSVMKLRRRPYIFLDGDKKIIKCCQYFRNNGSFDCSLGDLSSVKAAFRSRVFMFTDPNRVGSMFPKPAEIKEVFGLGFNLFFDRSSNPNSMNAMMFSLRNNCSITDIMPKAQVEKCLNEKKDRTKIDLELSMTIVDRGIQDTGAIDLGN